jgi:hypothetical protein
MGLTYPKRHYVELPYHTHAFTGISHTHGITDAGHYHTTAVGSHTHTGNFGLSTHTHNIAGSTASGGEYHVHSGVQTGAGDTQSENALHTHTISLGTDVPSATGSVSSTDIGSKNTDTKTTGVTTQGTVPTGSNAYGGVNVSLSLSSTQKLYGKNLTIKIDGTDVTAAVKTATGWTDIGDGTGTHALHTAGSGEMTASAWVTYAAGFHVLEVLEPEAGYGCRVMLHIETS